MKTKARPCPQRSGYLGIMENTKLVLMVKTVNLWLFLVSLNCEGDG